MPGHQNPAESEPPIRYLTTDGSPTLTAQRRGLDIQLARNLYRDMMRARRLDTESLALARQGELNLWLMSWGQEAAQVGSVHALRGTDMIFPSYREHAVALCRGLTPAQILTQWRGCAHAGWESGGTHHMHINSLVLGTQTLHAVGYATGAVMERTDEVVTVYFGDGAASQGDVNEALNWAAAAQLPVPFFCQNNQWAISTPASLQMRMPLHRRAAGFGLRSYHVDGNDALAVHAVTSEAAAHIRAGGGPVFIEAFTYRRGGHSTSDDPGRYRDDHELKLWESRDPLARVRAFLEGQGVEEGFFARLDRECDAFAEQVRTDCRGLPDPRLDDVFASTYAQPHPLVDDDYARYLAEEEFLGQTSLRTGDAA